MRRTAIFWFLTLFSLSVWSCAQYSNPNVAITKAKWHETRGEIPEAIEVLSHHSGNITAASALAKLYEMRDRIPEAIGVLSHHSGKAAIALARSILFNSMAWFSIARQQVLSVLKCSIKGLSQKSYTSGCNTQKRASVLNLPAKASWLTTFLLAILLLVRASDLRGSSSFFLFSSPISSKH